MRFAAFVACCAAASAVATNIPFKSCAKGATTITVDTVTVNGDIAPGDDVSLTASGKASAQVTGGNFDLKVKFLGITVFHDTGNFCTDKTLHIDCPISAGPVSASGSVKIPSIAPKGSYDMEVSATDSAGSQLFCISASLDISATRQVGEDRLSEPAMNADLISMVNQANAGWVAGENTKFSTATLGDAKQLCGAITSGERFEKARARLPTAEIRPLRDIPTSFDSRTKWSNCSDVIGRIRDQASCGSCWAVSSTESFNDRKCITTGGSFKTELSAQDTTSCCNLFGGCFGSSGCDGGLPSEAWQYFTKSGLVTGGPYDSIGKGTSCFPYQLPNCDHHEGGPFPPCTEGGSTPACPNPKACSESSYPKQWGDDKTYAKSAYGVPSEVSAIQTEIMNKGPVVAAFTVYEDFLTYRSGVYKHTSGQALGGHAVKILGWGVENGEDYWLVANSWNVNWGEKGYFKIARGVDECGIEDQIVAGDA